MEMLSDHGDPLTVHDLQVIWEREFKDAGGDLSRLTEHLTFGSPGSKLADGKNHQSILLPRFNLEYEVAVLQVQAQEAPGTKIWFDPAFVTGQALDCMKTAYKDTVAWLDQTFPSHRQMSAVLMAASAVHMSKREFHDREYEKQYVHPLLKAVWEYAKQMTGRTQLPWHPVASTPLHSDYRHRSTNELQRGVSKNIAREAIESMARQAAQFCREFVMIRASVADEPDLRTKAYIQEFHERRRREIDREDADRKVERAMGAQAHLAYVADMKKSNPGFIDMDALTPDELADLAKTKNIDDLVETFQSSKTDINSLYQRHGLTKPKRTSPQVQRKKTP